MLVHICCSVDSHYFLQELRKIYPNENLIGFFYNPNIHPQEEYDLRLQDVRRSCEALAIPLIVGEYDFMEWFDEVIGLENAEEKGERCGVCFETRLLKTAILALNLGESKITTTLLTSPLKPQNELFTLGENIAKKYSLEFIKLDLRSNGGTQKQAKLAKDANLYRQNYCGCEYALLKQRERKNEIALELFNEIGGRALKGSAKYNGEIFLKIWELERAKKPFILQKNTITAWRLLNATVKQNNSIVNAYIFTHSKSTKKQKIKSIKWSEKRVGGEIISIGFSDNATFLTIESINKIFSTKYSDTISMRYNPPKYSDERKIRDEILGSDSIKPLIVLDSAICESITINIEAIFQNVDIFEIVEI